MRRFLIPLALAATLGISACTASHQEGVQTRENREAINSGIPVPQLNFSIRRWVLSRFYESLARPRLKSCTIFTSRGGDKTELAMIETYGTAVNLSNQMTSPDQSEPDSIYVGPNDQTVVVSRNGTGTIAELDTTTVMGECPPDVERPKTLLQATIDHNTRREPEFNFLPKK